MYCVRVNNVCTRIRQICCHCISICVFTGQDTVERWVFLLHIALCAIHKRKTTHFITNCDLRCTYESLIITRYIILINQ